MRPASIKYLQLFLFCILLFRYDTGAAQTTKKNVVVSENPGHNYFPIFSNAITPTFYYDTNDAKVVQISAEAFAHYVKLISGKSLKIKTTNIVSGQYAIIAGTIGKSKIIDDLIKAKQINIDAIKNKWECFSIQIVNKTKLIIVGSDRRGTAFGHIIRT